MLSYHMFILNSVLKKKQPVNRIQNT